MQSTLLNFPNQLKWQPVVEGGAISPAGRYLLCGMGGSALAGGLLTACDLTIPLAIHRDYGLPATMEGSPLIIISSFSGNTEETLDVYHSAREAKLSLVVITAGGELLARARRDGVPQIILPDPTMPQRLAVGYFLRALALVIGAKQIGDELESLADILDLAGIETEGRALAKRLVNRVPLFYSSNRYAPIAYFWKIMMNEAAKIPAFSDVVPEENHNELEGFDGAPLAPFTIVALTSADDHPRVVKRFSVLTEVLATANVPVETIILAGLSPTERVVRSILTASFTALALAEAKKVDPDTVPTIENFKRHVAAA
ncbi:MAG: SIS domain-containing protein [Candidatus Vogelbacteria bacterium]